MSDLSEYIKKRKTTDPEFVTGYDSGYEEFKIGLMIKELRLKQGGPLGNGSKSQLNK